MCVNFNRLYYDCNNTLSHDQGFVWVRSYNSLQLLDWMFMTYLQKRNLAVVLLRRLFTSDFEELWEKLEAAHQSAVKEQLLLSIKQETDKSLNKKICDAAAELCRNLIG